MANIVGLHQVTRLLDVTGKSDKNTEDWENPCNLVFLARQLIRVMHNNMKEEYYCVFESDMDFCLDVLFK